MEIQYSKVVRSAPRLTLYDFDTGEEATNRIGYHQLDALCLLGPHRYLRRDLTKTSRT